MASVVHTPDGGSYIPASQRPDGTWRKARRVKEGYVPQEEVPLYESKGKQLDNRRTLYPIGFAPESLNNINEGKKKKKKKKPGEGNGLGIAGSRNEKPVQKQVQKRSTPLPSTLKLPEQPAVAVEPAKRLKNLRKKLREIDILERKIKSKELKCPEKDQLEKIARKTDILSEILALELTVK